MADPKNVIIDIKNGLADVRQQMNLVKQETAGWVSSLGSGVSRLAGFGGGGTGGGGVSSTLVAPNPKFSPPASFAVSGSGQASVLQGGALVPSGGGGGNIVAYTPSMGGAGYAGGGGGGGGGYTANTNLTDYVSNNPAAGFLYAAAVTGGMVDQPGESVEAQLLMSRVGYFNRQSVRAGTNTVAMGPNTYNDINRLQANLSAQATTKDKMDVMRGLAAAQSIGVTGTNITQATDGMSSVAGGVAAVSNLLPGAGFEGSMRAFSSMQQGRNVNMLRGIGIRLRDEQGNMKPPDQIIDDIWKKICRDYAGAYGSGKTPSKQEVLIGLQPGNSMDSMLDLYFGNDPMAKQIVANGLIYKAETGGGAISKAKLTELGGTTAAVNAQSERNAAQARQTGLTADAGARGYTDAAQAITAFSKFMSDKALPILEGITRTNAMAVTMLGAAGEGLPKLLAPLLAAGGQTAATVTAFLAAAGVGVGASVIAQEAMNNSNSSNSNFPGAGSLTGKGTPDAFATDLLKKLGAPPTKENIDSIKIWAKKESGATWGAKGGAYNPLNTTLKMDGSKNFNPVGVQNYQSMEQGVEATYQTLTGNQSQSRGYDRIVNLMRSGASKEELLQAISASSWAGSGGYKDGLKGITPDIAVRGNTTNNNNNTNVTINVTGTNKDPNAIAREIERILKENATRNKAANK